MAGAHSKMMRLDREEASLWKIVDENLLKATSASYLKATATLKDLQGLAAYKEETSTSKTRMKGMRERYAGRRALIRRFDGAGLV